MEEALNPVDQAEQSLIIQQIRQKLYGSCFRIGAWRTYKKGTVIFQSGDLPDAAYVLKEGRVRLFRMTQEGREAIFHIINPREGFGFAELIINQPRSRSAIVMNNNTTLCVVNRERLIKLLKIDNELCFTLTFLQAEYMLRYEAMAADMANLSVRGRVIQVLLRFARDYGKEMINYIFIELPFTHDEIAKMVGTSRQTVTSILTELRDAGFLSWEHKKIKIFQLDLLKNFIQ
jgi:CRP/FNR family cyclic AMP-dependent transcriptional regulator